jgi:hypothetical protein
MIENGKNLFRRYRDYHDPLLFSVAQGIFRLSTERLSRSTLHIKGGGGERRTSVVEP